MAKVIDALVVTLGLDPSGYKKGAAAALTAQAGLKQSAQAGATATTQATQAAGNAQKKLGKEQRDREREERKRRQAKERADRTAAQEEQKNTDATIDRLKSVGFAVAGAVLGFNTLKGAFSAYAGATNQLANLGRIAPTIGTDVKALDKLGDAYAQVTKDRQEALSDAGNDTAKLAHAQFSYAIHAPDDMAAKLRQLRVSLFDENNKPREKEQIENDIAAALKRQTSDLQTQAMYAREIGMSESFIQLQLVRSNSERDQILAKADKTAKATEAGAKSAQDQEQAWGRLKNVFKGVGENIVTEVSPGIAKSLNWVSDQLDQASGTSGERMLKSAGVLDKKKGLGQIPKSKFDSAFRDAEKKYGLPENTLRAIAYQESRFNENAVGPETKYGRAQGIMQMMPKWFPDAGKDPVSDIGKAGAEVSRLYKHYRRMYGSEQALTMSINAYNGGQKKVDRGTPLLPETKAYTPGVQSYMAAMSSLDSSGGSSSSIGQTNTQSSNVHIEQLSIHTAATDGPGIAATLPDALRRQNLIGQANSGLN